MRLGARAFRLAVLVSIGVAGVLPAADPFYERLKEDGVLAYARGAHQRAVDDLRLACFGLLEEPAELAEGLTYLALAQAEIGDQAAFALTVGRILEVERRFQAFSKLELGAGLRAALDVHLERWMPVEVLEDTAAFADAGRRKRRAQILALPPAERRQELERLILAEPEVEIWRLGLAELALSAADFTSAFDLAEQLLARAPELARARCVRGRSGAALGRCQQARLDLDSCDDAADPRDAVTESRLRCAMALADWVEADALLDRLSADQLRAAPFKQLAREIRKAKKAAPRQFEVPAPETAVGGAEIALPEAEGPIDAATPLPPSLTEPPPRSGVGEVAAPAAPVVESAAPPPAELPAAVATELEQLRERVRQAGSRLELGDSFTAAREIADAHPRLAEAQRVTAEAAYRLARWQDAVAYFSRAGDLDDSESQFYFSVALYEAGDPAAAREMLERCLPFLEPTDFVESYKAKILQK